MINNEEYKDKLLQLATTANGRLNNVISTQSRNSVGNVIDVTNINSLPDELIILSDVRTFNKNKRLDTFKKILFRDYIKYPTSIIWVTPTITATDDKVSITIGINVELLLDNKSKEDITSDSSFSSSISAVSSFTDLKKYLSGIFAGPVNIKFNDYLQMVNNKLKSNNRPPIDKFLVAIIDDINISDQSKVLSITNTDNAVKDNKNNISSTDKLNSSNNSSTSVNDSSTDKSITKESESNRKYLSIEAVSDDQVLLQRPTESKQFITVNLQNEEDVDLLTREGRTASITSPKSTKEYDVQNVTSTDDTKKSSVTNNKNATEIHEQKVQETEAQRIAENSDALNKEKIKSKNLSSPAVTNQLIQQLGGINQFKDSLSESNKPPVKDKQESKSKYFLEWAAKEGSDPNGIIYRGSKSRDYKKDPNSRPNITYGLVEKRYKNLFNFGSNLISIFNGYSIQSPVDVALLMNSGGVGRFNKNWPYLFGEGSEIHAAITRASNIDSESLGGFGTYGFDREFNDANWAVNPYWCGLCTNFMLSTNGQYQSDSNFVDITSTKIIEKLYKESPFNTSPTKKITKSEKEKLQKELDELNADTTGNNDNKRQNIIRKLNGSDEINLSNNVALLKLGNHWSSFGLTANGLYVTSLFINWPGAIIVRRSDAIKGGHVETLLHISKTGVLYTIGGNTGLENSDGNGSEYGFKKYNSIYQFCQDGKYDKFYILKRGILNSYTNGIGKSIKKTPTLNKYMSDVTSDKELNTAAYNILREIVEV